MAEFSTIEEFLSSPKPGFESRPTYSKSADCVELFFEDSDHYAERIDCWLTIYKAFDGDRVVGFMIKNVGTLLTRFDVLGLNCRVSGTKWAIQLSAFVACVPFVQPEMTHEPAFRDVANRVLHSNQAFELIPA